jgi:hypothetical protein
MLGPSVPRARDRAKTKENAMQFRYGYVTAKELDSTTQEVVGVTVRVDPDSIEPADDEARALLPADLDARREAIARKAELELRERALGGS